MGFFVFNCTYVLICLQYIYTYWLKLDISSINTKHCADQTFSQKRYFTYITFRYRYIALIRITKKGSTTLLKTYGRPLH